MMNYHSTMLTHSLVFLSYLNIKACYSRHNACLDSSQLRCAQQVMLLTLINWKLNGKMGMARFMRRACLVQRVSKRKALSFILSPNADPYLGNLIMF